MNTWLEANLHEPSGCCISNRTSCVLQSVEKKRPNFDGLNLCYERHTLNCYAKTIKWRKEGANKDIFSHIFFLNVYKNEDDVAHSLQ